MTAPEAAHAAVGVVRGNALTIAQILAHASALMDLPTFFKAAGIAESTGYQWVAEGQFPLDVIPVLRRRFVRTVEAWKFLGLLPDGNDNAPGVEPGAPVERTTAPTAK